MSETPEQELARSVLRAVQRLDGLLGGSTDRLLPRHKLVALMDSCGSVLNLECTGAVDGTNDDGSPAYYSHDGDTCPIHEWLVPADAETAEADRLYAAVEDEVARSRTSPKS